MSWRGSDGAATKAEIRLVVTETVLAKFFILRGINLLHFVAYLVFIV